MALHSRNRSQSRLRGNQGWRRRRLLPPTIPLSKAVQILKSCSSKWLNQTGATGKDFAWQEGYGAFSVSASQTDRVLRYIQNQPSHHAKRSYEDEFLELQKRCGISYDP